MDMEANAINVDKEFLEIAIQSLMEINEETEKVALQSMLTSHWKILARQQELLKSMQLYYKERFDEKHEPV